MVYFMLFAIVFLAGWQEAFTLSPSGNVEGSRWFEQMASSINQPAKPGFQDPGIQNPFQAQQPNIQPEGPNAGQTAPKQPFQQTVQNPGYQPRQPSLFELLFGPAFADPEFAPQTQGFQNQNQPAQEFKTQPAQGFEAKQPGMESQPGAGFKNAGFQPQQVQQPQQPPPNAGFQQPNVDTGFQPQQHQNTGFQGQQTGFNGQQNPAFNDPVQSEMSFFNNILRNFFMW